MFAANNGRVIVTLADYLQTLLRFWRGDTMRNFRSLTVAIVLTFTAPVPAALAVELADPAVGEKVGTVAEAFLTPHQEPGEEENTPGFIPNSFQSQMPSTSRAERKGRGYGQLQFTKDLSSVQVDVVVKNIDPEKIAMFHIHCGPPDLLGPILVDFGHANKLPAAFANRSFSYKVTNADIEATANGGHGVIGTLTAGCPIVPSNPLLGKVKTVAGMEYIARKGELYFNLHTKDQMFYGNIRGQILLRPAQ
jgi:hypothetical protein